MLNLRLSIGSIRLFAMLQVSNPPLHVIEGFVRRIWKDLEIDKVGMVNRGVFLIRFALQEHQECACNMILFDKKPFIVKL